jgi:hypothetical protein
MGDKKHRFGDKLVVLILVAGCSFLLGKHMEKKKHAWSSAVAAHHAAVNRCRALGQEANKRIMMAFRARMSIVEFEKEFGKTVPVGQGTFPETREETTHVYTHEPSHRVFYLRFENGVLLGVSSGHSVDDIGPHLPSIEERLAQR